MIASSVISRNISSMKPSLVVDNKFVANCKDHCNEAETGC
jgi:hypothetical protein